MTIVNTIPKMGHIRRSKGNGSAGPSDSSGAVSIRLTSDVGNGSIVVIKVVVITLLAAWWRGTCCDICASYWTVDPGVSQGGSVAVSTGERGTIDVEVACRSFSAVGAMVLGTLSVVVSWGTLLTLLATKAVAIKGSMSLSFADLAMEDWDV